MEACSSWETISAADYHLAFENFGGSFAVHPQVVALVSSLASRPVRYVGLTSQTEILAAAPLWGEHVVATKQALEHYSASHLIDVGDSEVVLPISNSVRINMPFKVSMLSSLHLLNIINLEQDKCPYPSLESISSLTLARGLRTGRNQHTAKSKKRRRLQIQRFQELGGQFRPLCDFSTNEIVAIYTQLYKKRWGDSAYLMGESCLPVVFGELRDLLAGDMLFFDDRPVAMELVYKHVTPLWLFANCVQMVRDPEFIELSAGKILFFHNLDQLENEAIASNRTLRYCLGWNDAAYKSLRTYEEIAYRVRATNSPEDVEIVRR